MTTVQNGACLDEAPVPDPATIQKMLDQFRELASPNAPAPHYDYPSPGNSSPQDLPAADVPYTIQDAQGQSFDIRPIYYDALPFRGNPTRVFAWIGLPSDTKAAPVPGMVCVHGGGGTAFKEWVEQWCSRGYAAISIAVEGQTDEKRHPAHEELDDYLLLLDSDDNNPHNRNPPFWNQHSHPGPRRPDSAFNDYDELLEDQWMFHCVADAMLANSLLRSLPQVDSSCIGLTGISWGGVITSLVGGLDLRFSLIIPVYGCGDLGHANSYLGRGIHGHVDYYYRVWDACLYLPQATMPSLWISWPEDPHFPMINFKRTYESMGSANKAMVSLIPGLLHGHKVGWRRGESYTFAKYVWSHSKTGGGWCQQISGDVIHHNGRTMAQVKFSAELFSFQRADLIWSCDGEDVEAGKRKWQSSQCLLKPSATQSLWAAEAVLPEDAAAWIINLYTGQGTKDGLVVTSVYQDLKLFAYAVMVDSETVPASSKKRFGWFW